MQTSDGSPVCAYNVQHNDLLLGRVASVAQLVRLDTPTEQSMLAKIQRPGHTLHGLSCPTAESLAPLHLPQPFTLPYSAHLQSVALRQLPGPLFGTRIQLLRALPSGQWSLPVRIALGTTLKGFAQNSGNGSPWKKQPLYSMASGRFGGRR